MRRISFAQRFIAYLCCLSLNVPVLAQAHTIGPNGPIPVERAPLPLPAPESVPESRPVPPPVTKPVNTPMPAPVHTPAESETTGKRKKEIYYIHTDHLNTPRAITNGEQKKVWKWGNVDPFGKNTADENPEGWGRFAFNLRFPGQYYDRETGLHYNWHRDYDPIVGRYVQSDPIGLEGGLNIYGYVAGNPLIYVDPTGEFLPIFGLAGWAYSGLAGAIATAYGAMAAQLLTSGSIGDIDGILLAILFGFTAGALLPYLGMTGLGAGIVGGTVSGISELVSILREIESGKCITYGQIISRMGINIALGSTIFMAPWLKYTIWGPGIYPISWAIAGNYGRMRAANSFFGLGSFLTFLGVLDGGWVDSQLTSDCACKGGQ